jgi:hypothetical protein
MGFSTSDSSSASFNALVTFGWASILVPSTKGLFLIGGAIGRTGGEGGFGSQILKVPQV